MEQLQSSRKVKYVDKRRGRTRLDLRSKGIVKQIEKRREEIRILEDMLAEIQEILGRQQCRH